MNYLLTLAYKATGTAKEVLTSTPDSIKEGLNFNSAVIIQRSADKRLQIAHAREPDNITTAGTDFDDTFWGTLIGAVLGMPDIITPESPLVGMLRAGLQQSGAEQQLYAELNRVLTPGSSAIFTAIASELSTEQKQHFAASGAEVIETALPESVKTGIQNAINNLFS